MATVNLAEAKAHLSAFVEAAARGETVCILRRGKPVAQIVAMPTQCKPIDPAALRAVTSQTPKRGNGAGKLVRPMRDEARY
jgi:prevent-host-death family protein